MVSIEKFYILCFWRFEQKKSSFSTLEKKRAEKSLSPPCCFSHRSEAQGLGKVLKIKGNARPVRFLFFVDFRLRQFVHSSPRAKIFKKSFQFLRSAFAFLSYNYKKRFSKILKTRAELSKMKVLPFMIPIKKRPPRYPDWLSITPRQISDLRRTLLVFIAKQTRKAWRQPSDSAKREEIST